MHRIVLSSGYLSKAAQNRPEASVWHGEDPLWSARVGARRGFTSIASLGAVCTWSLRPNQAAVLCLLSAMWFSTTCVICQREQTERFRCCNGAEKWTSYTRIGFQKCSYWVTKRWKGNGMHCDMLHDRNEEAKCPIFFLIPLTTAPWEGHGILVVILHKGPGCTLSVYFGWPAL